MAWVALLESWVRLPMGAKFRLGLKKIPSSVPHQSTGLRPGPGCSNELQCHWRWQIFGDDYGNTSPDPRCSRAAWVLLLNVMARACLMPPPLSLPPHPTHTHPSRSTYFDVTKGTNGATPDTPIAGPFFLLKLDEVGSQFQCVPISHWPMQYRLCVVARWQKEDMCNSCVWSAGGKKSICDNISPDHVSLFSHFKPKP
jgi:hypothetical protein